jgi:hypothetical protein
VLSRRLVAQLLMELSKSIALRAKRHNASTIPIAMTKGAVSPFGTTPFVSEDFNPSQTSFIQSMPSVHLSFSLSQFQNPASSSHITIIITTNIIPGQKYYMVTPPFPILFPKTEFSTGPTS